MVVTDERPRRGPRRFTLRHRVLAAFVGVAAISLLVTAITINLIHGNLLDQVDQTLQADAGIVQSAFIAHPGSAEAQANAGLLATTSSAVLIRPGGTAAPIIRGANEGVALLLGHPHLPDGPTTVGNWRFYTVGVSGGGRITVGESLASVQLTGNQVSGELVVASTVTLLLLLILSAWVVSIGVRPFTEIATVARRITDGHRGERIEVTPRSEGTEFGDVAYALNTMLAGMESALDQEEAVTAQLRQFVADAGHELRTPLTSIAGYTELLEQGVLSEQAKVDALGRVSAEAARMHRLIESLLSLARLEGSGTAGDVTLEQVDLAALAAAMVHDHEIIDTGGAYPVTVAGKDHLVVTGSSDQFATVLGNLLSNLRDHTPTGTEASLTVVEDNGDAVVTYRDNGPGVDDPHRIFTRFWQADNGRRGVGSGLGMAISEAVAAAHGGSLAASTTPGGGLTVVFRVPLEQPLSEESGESK